MICYVCIGICYVFQKLCNSWKSDMSWYNISTHNSSYLKVLCTTEMITFDFPGDPVVESLPPIQGTWVQSLVQKDSTCCGTTMPVYHNC